MKLTFDPGTEQYVEWAKRKLRGITALRLDTRLPKMTKAFVPASGVLVHIVSSEWGDSIRITGGPKLLSRNSAFFNASLKSGVYYTAGRRIKEYIEGSATAAFHTTSFNVRTLLDSSNFGASGSLTRCRRPPQIFTTGLLGNQGGGGIPYTVKYNRGVTQLIVDDGGLLSRWEFPGSIGLSKDGTRVVYPGWGGAPVIARMTSAQALEEQTLPPEEWTSPTSYDVLSTGEQNAYPNIVTDFYAEQFVATGIENKVNWSDTSGNPGWGGHPNNVLVKVPGGAWFSPYWARLHNGVFLFPQFDFFNDRFYMLAVVPFVHKMNIQTGVLGSRLIDVFASTAYLLCEYDFAALRWVERQRNIQPGSWGFVQETAGVADPPAPPSREGTTVYVLDGLDVVDFPLGARRPIATQLGSVGTFSVGTGQAGFPDDEGTLLAKGAAPTLIYEKCNIVHPADGHAPFFSLDGANVSGGGPEVSSSIQATIDTSPTAPTSRLFMGGELWLDTGFKYASTPPGGTVVHRATRDAVVLVHTDDVLADRNIMYYSRAPAKPATESSPATPAGPFEVVDVGSFIQREPHLNTDGTKLVVATPTQMTYYERTALKATIFSLASAPPATEELYNSFAGIPKCLRFFNRVHGWSYDRDVLRVSGYTHITRTTFGDVSFYAWEGDTVAVQWDEALGGFRVVQVFSDEVKQIEARPGHAPVPGDPTLVSFSEASWYQDEFIATSPDLAA